uniref:Heat shock protein family A member 12 variant X11 n=1 Tax=Urechis unicinctus TaxID=6432 RepID=A0AAU0MTL2_UREUN
MTNQGCSAEELSSYYTIVVAIDFGTTYSGYSFSFKKKPEDIFTQTTWGEIDEIPSSAKTPTCVLTDAKGKLVAIGYKAQKLFSEMDSQEARCHRFYSHFKMKLHTEKNLTKDTKIEDQSGKKTSALDICAMMLKAIKLEMLTVLESQGVERVDVNLIRWVLTVPAIWTDGAKQFMRQAAVQAGLVEETDSGNLILALEPEAASLCCQKLPLAKFAMRGDSSVKLSTGTKYLVLDAGGGTVDITAHKVLKDNQLEELYWANGGAMGGNRVNESFRVLLADIFKGEFMDTYRLRDPGDYNSLMNKLEIVKKGFNPHDSSSFRLTIGMSNLYEELFGKKISGCVTPKYTTLGVKVSNGLIKIPPAVLETIFTPVVNDILSHVDCLFKKDELRGIKIILMVGGFSNCAFLQQAIKKKFTKCDVLVPK